MPTRQPDSIPMADVILNADLGEGEPIERSVQLIQVIGAANIACGGHAGTDESMRACLLACREHETLPGAHPGMDSGFGRTQNLPSPGKFRELLKHQWTRISQIAQSENITLHHIKLHGTLYMAVEQEAHLAEVFLHFLKSLICPPIVFTLAGGSFHQRAKSAGLTVWGEMFADRQYESDGSLRARSHPDALIHETELIVQRISHWLKTGTIDSWDHSPIQLKARTCCIHADTQNALVTARKLNALLST